MGVVMTNCAWHDGSGLSRLRLLHALGGLTTALSAAVDQQRFLKVCQVVTSLRNVLPLHLRAVMDVTVSRGLVMLQSPED